MVLFGTGLAIRPVRGVHFKLDKDFEEELFANSKLPHVRTMFD